MDFLYTAAAIVIFLFGYAVGRQDHINHYEIERIRDRERQKARAEMRKDLREGRGIGLAHGANVVDAFQKGQQSMTDGYDEYDGSEPLPEDGPPTKH
ncbi:hypothetical protein J2J97_32480 (plasmid) [Rhizobium bangladeshense]|uniref:hypothetical protein n=1 Tax=Rhizobium bangladeshense TaxID=1138189 RepID=UPI001A997273|nr:hypothetical protein [Rhizobium bangladeshense]QSY98622.1 hypothetical protein J2J97_32480 [Rhizobium bangladeshense]